MSCSPTFWLMLALTFTAGSVCRAEHWRADVDPTGMLWGILHDGALVPVRAHFTVATPRWETRLGPARGKDVRCTQDGHARTWSGGLELKGRQAFRYAQTVREAGGRVDFSLQVRALVDARLAGVYLDVKVPAGIFGGGTCVLSRDGEEGEERELPPPESRDRAAAGSARRITFRSPGEGRLLEFTMDRARRLTVNAHPGWLMPHYRVLIPLHEGGLSAGQTVGATFGFRLAGKSDRSPVKLRLNAARERYRLQGFGGNYCFWPNTPAVDYTLDHLRPVWARTQMFLHFWEPKNDDADPRHINWSALRDKEESQWILRAEMEAARKMARRGIPFIISCWQVPDWMRVPRGQAGARGRRPIDRQAWPEVVESICSYLLYLKEKYGAEPEMFSFNEPRLGRIPDPEDHRDFSKMLAGRMRELGLKTGILAGDVSNPRGDSIEYPKPLLNDPEARRYVRGISFHSWGGARPETYRAWADLARSHDLPLFVAELGWYALAHRSRASRTALYALEELRTYQELLLHARPQVLLEWEYGGSYPLLLEEGDELRPTARYWMIHQFATLTPSPAVALGTESDNPEVLFTAFRGRSADGRSVYALHVANLGADRPMRLEGLPTGPGTLEATWVNALGDRRAGGTVSAQGGVLQTRLTALSLLTLRWSE
ncbi:MAG: hypothetical protein PVJ27_05530 [Candidatus Brocadiaceae bacterium]|jgi:hypothetical protein